MSTPPIIIVQPHASSTPRTVAVSEIPVELGLSNLPGLTTSLDLRGGDLDDDYDYTVLPDPNDQDALVDLLLSFGVRGADKNVDEGFWPYARLRRVMTRERVLRALREECGFEEAEARYCCSMIMPADKHPSTTSLAVDSIRWSKTGETRASQQASYLRIFAILILYSRGSLVRHFIEQGVSDRELPLRLAMAPTAGPGRRNVATPRLEWPAEPVPRPLDWFQPQEIRRFLSTQWPFIPPYFAPSARGDVAHYEIPPEAILPWVKISSANDGQSTWTEGENSGGYGVVKKVKIDRDCHSLDVLLGSAFLQDQFFAVKSLRKSDIGQFEKEVEMLKRFSGTAHPHLVTLLATFAHNDCYNFIFPWAQCDLDQWWSGKYQIPTHTPLQFRQWVAKQMFGLADAMHAIHEPRQGSDFLLPEEKKYGRHGDLKPENILWFLSNQDPLGILVISDFGIAAVHRDVSRSNVPNENLPCTPRYRPPECDMDGGKISRAFDIWTMGCIFLEMAAWLLGGAKGREEFKRERRAPYLAMIKTDLFFDIQEMPASYGMTRGRRRFVFLVKEGVVKYIEKLHAHPACTGYLHHLLQLVHDEMLVVMSPTRQRIRARPLSDRLRNMRQRVDPAYLLQPRPWPGCRIERYPAVEAPLIPNARRMLAAQPGRGLAVFTNGATEAMTVSHFSDLQGD
ncbi:hypothetical protein RB601_003104 [Gaeumannomyces tritici]